MCACIYNFFFCNSPVERKGIFLLPCREEEGKKGKKTTIARDPIPAPVSPRAQSLKSVHASTTMRRTVVALVLAIGALAGRIDAQGNKSVRASVKAYVHRVDRMQMQAPPFRASSETRARRIRLSSPSAPSPAAAQRAPFAVTPWHSMRAL